MSLNGVNTQCARHAGKLSFYLKLYILLYADDTVILAESPQSLQAGLNAMYLYCKTWNMTVNPTKTKIVIFTRSKIKDNYQFSFNGEALNVDNDFNYLGISFHAKGTFYGAKKKIVETAKKHLFRC